MNKRDNDKLIAEFMGDRFDTGLEPEYYIRKNKEYKLDESEYSTSLDWLMPVVEKISKDFEKNKNFQLYNKYLNECENREDFLIFRLSKEDTYKAIIEFIKWYNKQINK